MFVKGSTAVSLSGRDKGAYYAVVDTDEAYIYVCDGKAHPLDNPKRKNPKHLSVLGAGLDREAMASNRALRKALASIKGAGE